MQAYSASQGGPSVPKPRLTTIPLPPYAEALNKYTARLLAMNAKAQPPSFSDYVKSGGTEQFPLVDPGLTPTQAANLGLVTPQGKPQKWVSPQATSMTPEQRLYLGQRQLAGGTPAGAGTIERAAQIQNILNNLAKRSNLREGQINRGTRLIGKEKSILGLS